MTGPVCLQGGGEFSSGCRPMDAEVLQRVTTPARPPRVVVTALACAPGRDARTAEAHGVDHYRSLGAAAVAAPDARSDADGARAALADADLVVLPGGSPSRLLETLQCTPVGAWLVDAVAGGTSVSGASAGAMVLCAWTVLPEGRQPAVVPGLGIVPRALVLPHWSGDADRESWLRAVDGTLPEGTELLGLPEQSGVLLDAGRLRAVGLHPTRFVRRGSDLAPGDARAAP